MTARPPLGQQVAESAERLWLALESTEDGLWDWDVRTGELTVNPRWLTMLGDEPMIKPSLELWSQHICHPEDLPRARPSSSSPRSWPR